jgi:hypothetical protein
MPGGAALAWKLVEEQRGSTNAPDKQRFTDGLKRKYHGMDWFTFNCCASNCFMQFEARL